MPANNDVFNIEDLPLFRVRAQVMTRDDSSGGWVPLGGGGLSNISVRKTDPDSDELIIKGKRISDQLNILNCTIKKDFEIFKVMPTFHHWISGERKFGLTFQTASDARAFDKCVSSAIDTLPEGLSSSRKRNTEVGEDEVFMAVDLPVERDSVSSSSGSGQYATNAHLHRMYFNSRAGSKDGNGDSSREMQSASSKDKASDKDIFLYEKRDEVYSAYVQFATMSLVDHPHDYSYPTVKSDKKPSPSEFSNSRSMRGIPKKPLQLDPLSLQPPPLLPTKSTGNTKKKRICGAKRMCRDCLQVYSEDSNPRGSCPVGKDLIRDSIETVTCMGCARGMLYHCLSGEEGEVPQHPCAIKHHRCCLRWVALGILSIFLPCLCLYIPLAGCHKASKSCHICGARHHPS